MSVTTIKVDSTVRDQLAAIAAERGMTQGSVVEMLLASYVRKQRMDAVREAMARSSDEDWRTYWEETAAWDAVAQDGLQGY